MRVEETGETKYYQTNRTEYNKHLKPYITRESKYIHTYIYLSKQTTKKVAQTNDWRVRALCSY